MNSRLDPSMHVRHPGQEEQTIDSEPDIPGTLPPVSGRNPNQWRHQESDKKEAADQMKTEISLGVLQIVWKSACSEHRVAKSIWLQDWCRSICQIDIAGPQDYKGLCVKT